MIPSFKFFLIDIEVFSKLTSNIISKNLKISNIFLEKSLELRLYDKSKALMVVLILCLLKTNDVIEKWGDKQDIIHLHSSEYLKIIFIQVTKMITVHIKSFKICFYRFSFKTIF